MRACARNGIGVCSGWFEVAQRLGQGCVLSPLLFHVLFTVMLLVTIERFSEDADILADLAHLQEQSSKVGHETAMECARRAIWGVLYANDGSPRGLEPMIGVFVEVCGALGLTISESKTDTMCMPIPRAPATQIVFNATGQLFRHRTSFIYLGGAIHETLNLFAEIGRRVRAGWMSFGRFKRELFDRPKTSRVESEVVQ